MRSIRHLPKVVQCPEDGIDVHEVGDVVAEVLHGTLEDRGEPQRSHPEAGEVIQPRSDAPDISDAVAVRVLERPRVDLVNVGRPPPRPLSHCRCREHQDDRENIS